MRPTPAFLRVLPILTVLAAVGPGAPEALEAQDTESPLTPAGRLRVDVAPSVLLWDSRFGFRAEGGTFLEESEPLGFDLVDPEGYGVFPGVADLPGTLRELLDDPDLPVPLGASRAEVSAERIRLPFGLDVGIFDWLSIGVRVPLEKNRTEVTHLLRGAASELGVTPAIGRPGDVAAFLSALETARAGLGEVGGSPELESRLAAFEAGLAELYASASLFPVEGSAAGTALAERMQVLNDALQEAGVGPVQRPLPLASGPLVGPEGVSELLTGPDFGYLTGLEDVPGIWELGDVEVHGVVRLLGGAVQDSVGAPARVRWEVGIGGLVRLPTGTTDDPDLVLDLGSGDGQMDLEGRAFANFTVGRLGLWADGRYGVQQSTTLVRRVAPPDQLLVPLASRREVEWTPGSYLRFEVAPRFHLTPELALIAGYRYTSQEDDEYAEIAETGETGEDPPQEPSGFQGYLGPLWDAAALEAETGWTTHELGGGLIFSTLDALREGRTSLPFEVRFSVRKTVSGEGGRVPEALTAQLGIRVYRRLWGG